MSADLLSYPVPYFVAATIFSSLTTPAFAQDGHTGRTVYVANCASCHGESGKGDGPVSEALRTRPSDLTLLAKNNNGVFPGDVLFQIVDGRRTLRAHGSYEMPVWGGRINHEQISSILTYLRSLQLN
jgi:mono/diheme cytochrome c family protein